jgi:drug/metabolite transporter (DMT)-like permease
LHHDEKKARKDKAVIMLSALTIMWGTTFAVTQNALNDVSSILFATMRFGLAYLIYIAFSKAARDSIHIIINPKTELERDLRHKSVVLGIALGMGYVLQFVGLETTTTSKSAFLTATTVVWTPMLAILITKHVLNLPTIFAIITCLIGIILLTHPFPVEEIVIGDVYSLGCAMCFGVYIFQLDRIMPKALEYEHSELRAVMMVSALQLVVGVVAILLVMPFAEAPHVEFTGRFIIALLYTTIFATVLSTYIQAMYQKEITPVAATLIYTLEPVAAVIVAYIFMNEQFTLGEWIGGALIVGGMLLGQIRQ